MTVPVNEQQIAEDICVFIMEMDWPEMKHCGRNEDGSRIYGPRGQTMALRFDETHCTAMMHRAGVPPVFAQLYYGDGTDLVKWAAVEFMDFCTKEG